jgi:hypothetical protein
MPRRSPRCCQSASSNSTRSDPDARSLYLVRAIFSISMGAGFARRFASLRRCRRVSVFRDDVAEFHRGTQPSSTSGRRLQCSPLTGCFDGLRKSFKGRRSMAATDTENTVRVKRPVAWSIESPRAGTFAPMRQERRTRQERTGSQRPPRAPAQRILTSDERRRHQGEPSAAAILIVLCQIPTDGQGEARALGPTASRMLSRAHSRK